MGYWDVGEFRLTWDNVYKSLILIVQFIFIYWIDLKCFVNIISLHILIDIDIDDKNEQNE